MTVDKFLNKWYNKEFENWGGETSPEYKNFQTNYKSVIKEICNDIGMNLYSFNKNHYEFSAVVKSNTTNQFYYISISDVRYWKMSGLTIFYLEKWKMIKIGQVGEIVIVN